MTTIEDKYYYKYLKYKRKYLQLLYELYGSGRSKSDKRFHKHSHKSKILNPEKSELKWLTPFKKSENSEIANSLQISSRTKQHETETYDIVIFIVAHGELLHASQQNVPDSVVMIKSLPTQPMFDSHVVTNIIDEVKAHYEKKDKLSYLDINKFLAIHHIAYQQHKSFIGKAYYSGDIYTDVNISTVEQTVFNQSGMIFVFLIPYTGVIKEMVGNVMKVTLDGVNVTLNGYNITYEEGTVTPTGKHVIYLIYNEEKILVEPYILNFIEFNKWIYEKKTMARYVIDPDTKEHVIDPATKQPKLELVDEMLPLSRILGELKKSFSKFILMLHACSSLLITDDNLGTDKEIAEIYANIQKQYQGDPRFVGHERAIESNKKFIAMLRKNGLYNKYLKQI